MLITSRSAPPMGCGRGGPGILDARSGTCDPGDPDHVVAREGKKMRVADQIGSRALRADAVGSITCGYLSGVVVLGLIVQLLMPGWWWVDSATSLLIVVLLIKEGYEAWEAEKCAD